MAAADDGDRRGGGEV
jgi:hypothetical protein